MPEAISMVIVYLFFCLIFPQLAKRARGVVHVMLNGTRQHFLDKQIFPSFMDDRFERIFSRQSMLYISFLAVKGKDVFFLTKGEGNMYTCTYCISVILPYKRLFKAR